MRVTTESQVRAKVPKTLSDNPFGGVELRVTLHTPRRDLNFVGDLEPVRRKESGYGEPNRRSEMYGSHQFESKVRMLPFAHINYADSGKKTTHVRWDTQQPLFEAVRKCLCACE